MVTKQYETTTLLYYAFFLPGIFLHEFIYWATAGFLNVRADHSIRWPEKQEIGQLKLNFVKLAPKTSAIKLTVISTMPFIVGLLLIWFIANNILNIQVFLATLRGGYLDNVGAAVTKLTTKPDFWIWFYLAFTISNTMMPHTIQHLRTWWMIAAGIGAVALVSLVIGVGDKAVINLLNGPVANSLNQVSAIFAVIIGINLFMVAILGTIEAIIERITGDSATFENGKMITMRRSEMLALRAQSPNPLQQRTAAQAAKTTVSGPPSVYKLPLPIPGAPGREAVSRDNKIIIEPEPTPALSASAPNTGRSGPALITGSVSERSASPPASTEPKSEKSSPIEIRPPISPPTPQIRLESPVSKPIGASVTIEPPASANTSNPASVTSKPSPPPLDDDEITYEDVEDPA